MICRKIGITVLTISFFSLAIFAEPQELTVSQAVELALNQNTTIEKNKITVTANKRKLNHSWNSISPSFTASGSYSKPNEKTNYDWRMQGSAGVSISFTPSLFASIAAARLNYENGLISYEEACRDIELNVRTSFYSLLYEKEYINLQTRRLETAKQQYQQNKIKYNNGRISELDVLSAQVSYEKMIPSVEDANISFLNDIDTFKQLLNIPAETEITLKGSLDDIQGFVDKTFTENEIQAWVNNSAKVKTLQKNLESAKIGLTAARLNTYTPTITGTWNYQPSTNSKADGKITDGGSFTLSATIPLDGILPWSTKADNISTLKDTVKSYEIQLADAKRTTEVSINNYLRQIKQTQSSVNSLNSSAVLAQKTYEMTLDAYNRGAKDYLMLQNAADSLFEARISVKQKLFSLISTILKLENTTGVPFGSLNK